MSTIYAWKLNANTAKNTLLKNCDLYIRIRDTSWNTPNKKAADYVFNCLNDYFNLNDLTRQLFKLNISREIVKENALLYIEEFQKKEQKNM